MPSLVEEAPPQVKVNCFFSQFIGRLKGLKQILSSHIVLAFMKLTTNCMVREWLRISVNSSMLSKLSSSTRNFSNCYENWRS